MLKNFSDYRRGMYKYHPRYETDATVEGKLIYYTRDYAHIFVMIFTSFGSLLSAYYMLLAVF